MDVSHSDGLIPTGHEEKNDVELVVDVGTEGKGKRCLIMIGYLKI